MATRRRRAGQARVQADLSRVMYGARDKQTKASTVQGEAKRQTRADKLDFKKNRAAGDEEMRARANDTESAKWGGPSFPTKPAKNGRTNRTLVDDPNKITTQKTPNLPQNETKVAKQDANKKDAEERKKKPQYNQQELDDLKRMEQEEGIEELKKQKSSHA